MTKRKIILTFVPMILGIMIYVIYRSTNLFYIRMVQGTPVFEYVLNIRQIGKMYRHRFPLWAIYSLPDGLWLFSFGAAFLINRYRYFLHLTLFSIVYVITISTELLQKYYGGHGTLIGTYDVMDVYAYTIAYISIVIISFLLNIINENKKEFTLWKELQKDIIYLIVFYTMALLPVYFPI